MRSAYHEPVLPAEVVGLLDPKPGQTFVDSTVGGGGHSALIGERLGLNGTLVAIDQDREALAASLNKLYDLSPKIVFIHGNFRNLRALLVAHGIGAVDGILFDLGVSSHQLDSGERGFSFRVEAPLDMRMESSAGVPASELLARLDRTGIEQILREWGEERWAARIAQFIDERRKGQPILTTSDLAAVVEAAIPRKAWPTDIHPATRTFQALRIAVNDELSAVQEGIRAGVEMLKIGGRIAVISFHSLEDRIVKQSFLRLSGRCQCPPRLPECRCGARQVVRILTRKPVTASEEEKKRNPRSRSAKLRVAERTHI